MKSISQTMSTTTTVAAAVAASLLMSLSQVSGSGTDPCFYVGMRVNCGVNCYMNMQCQVWNADKLQNVTAEAIKGGAKKQAFDNMCLGFKVRVGTRSGGRGR